MIHQTIVVNTHLCYNGCGVPLTWDIRRISQRKGSIRTMNCENCGRVMSDNAVICPNCGTATPASMPKPDQPRYTPPQQGYMAQQPGYPPQQSQPGYMPQQAGYP